MRNWQKKDPQYAIERKKYPNPIPSRLYILQTFKNAKESLSFAALAKLFKLNNNEKEMLEHRIKAMLRDEQLEQRANGKLRIAKKRAVLLGKVFAHVDGYGFFIPQNKSLTNGDDLFLSYREMHKVMHGDVIEARLLKKQYKGKKEGKVVRIIKRANKRIIGRLVNNSTGKVIKAENRRISQEIIATNVEKIKVKNNQIVVIEITTYPDKNQAIIGRIIKVLDEKMAMGIEVDIAITNYNLPYEWSKDVEKQTASITDGITADDYACRIDLRDMPLVTIDDITSRDFDDAVCVKKTAAGYLLYVAIADVAHYVKKDSPLDKEAMKRGTSVYFPNRVIPMLPEKLSNNLCSLNPDVDRLCMVCEMLINFDGQIKHSKFYEAVMRSHARLTYSTVEDLLFNETSVPENNKYSDLIPHLINLRALYLILRKKRDQRGAINFNTVTPKFIYDDLGKITNIVPAKHLKSHELIEEFMISANVCAAKFLLKQQGKNKAIALFRNHQGPSEEKLEKLITALAQKGIKLNKTDSISSKQLSDIINKIKNHDNADTIQILILRSMYQAIYQMKNEGHFGLALDYYSHFTSPIRRYPDLLVHRAIKHIIKYKDRPYYYFPEQMLELGEQCSMTERRAEDAVYDVIDGLKSEYMADKIGQQFAATISSVTNFGFFANLDEQFIDGLVHVSNLEGDYFNFDEQQCILIGERSKKIYKAGDRVKVIVSNVSIEDRRIDLTLVKK